MKGNYYTISGDRTVTWFARRTRDGEVKWRIRFGVWAAYFPSTEGHYAADMLIKDECRLVVYQGIFGVNRYLLTSTPELADLLKAIVLEQNYER